MNDHILDWVPHVDLVRLIVFTDQVVFARFSDSRSLLLHPSCSTYTSIDSKGNFLHNVTACALHQDRERLSHVISFRNLWFDRPYTHKLLVHSDQGPYVAPEITLARWPCTPDSPNVVAHGGFVTIKSLDGNSCLKLLPHHKYFKVRFPSPIVSPSMGIEEHNTKTDAATKICDESPREYTYVTQIFSVDSYPERWQHPLELALAKHQQILEGSSTSPQPRKDSLLTSDVVTSLPPCLSALTDLKWSPDTGRSTRLLHAIDGLLPQDKLVLVEWTAEMTTHVIHNTGIVQGLVHIDDSILCVSSQTTSLYHHLYSKGSTSKEIYSICSVPIRLGDAGEYQGPNYALPPLVERLLFILQHTHAVSKFRLAEQSDLSSENYFLSSVLPTVDVSPAIFPGPSGTQPVGTPVTSDQSLRLNSATLVGYSATLHLERTYADVGVFSAFIDGRVRVKYVDRTILELDARGQSCHILTPFGECKTYPVDCLISSTQHEFHQHAVNALAFQRWSFMSASTKVKHIHQCKERERIVNHFIDATSRHLKMLRILNDDGEDCVESYTPKQRVSGNDIPQEQNEFEQTERLSQAIQQSIIDMDKILGEGED